MNAKSHTSSETILLFAAVSFLVMIIIFFTYEPQEQVYLRQAEDMVDTVCEYSNRLSGMSSGSRYKVRLNLPNIIEAVTYSNSEINVIVAYHGNITELHRQTKSQLTGYSFGLAGTSPHSGPIDITIESFGSYVCIYPPGRRQDYCLVPSVRTSGLSEEAKEPTAIEYYAGQRIRDDIVITNLSNRSVGGFYITDHTGPCNAGMAGSVSAWCIHSEGESIIYCNITLISILNVSLLDTVRSVYGCVQIGDEWYKTPAEYYNMSSGCGDLMVHGNEECDDGNNMSGDGCNANCRFEYCGDGLLTLTDPKGFYKDHGSISIPEECEKSCDLLRNTSRCQNGKCHCNPGFVPDYADPPCCRFTQCNDGIDNDGDGNIDYPKDHGCDSKDDDSE